MSDALSHAFFNNVGNSGSFSSSLPTQTLLSSQKTPKWKKLCLDRLEQIAERQFSKNIRLNDFFLMCRGKLIYSDYGLEDLTKEIIKLRGEMDFPVHAKHYDFLGIIVNQIKGEYTSQKDKYRIFNTDEISQNELSRTKTAENLEYTQKLFNYELEQKLLKKGIVINPDQQFESEEEQQAYLQFIEEEKAKLIPPEAIQKELSKSWKTIASEWAEKTLEYDQQRDDFDMDNLNAQEIEDYLLTGRWFRHYFIGYDYYKPERWHPCTTFFSEDIDIHYPQDGEYVGRIHWMSPSDIQNRYGDKITDDIHRRLSGYFDQSNEYAGAERGNTSLEGMFKKNFAETQHIPFEGYHDYDLTLQLQDVFDTPFGETVIQEDGDQKKIPAWFSPLNKGNGFFHNNMARELRSDIDIRTDLLQVTETYWRSYRRIGILNYINEDGMLDQVFTTDDLLSDYLKENEISTLRKVTLEQSQKKIEPNTICYTWIPEIRWGVKVKAGNSYLLEDLYIGGDPLEFQLKGSGNIYDAQLPVAGYIGDCLAEKLRPYIIKHNIVLNQVHSLLEKELGTFFLFDVHYLPAEYKNNVSTRQALEDMYELITDLSIVPIDTSKQNMQGNQPAMNAFMTQSLDFTSQIVNRMNLATQFKLQALEQIGITQQRTGSPSEYSTAEGIKQGMTASYAQTEPIFSVMSASSKKANMLHLTVAQFCQKNSKDYSFSYTKSDGEQAFIELSDPYFNLRQFGLRTTGNSKEKKELETLKSALLNDNTIASDIMSLASIVASDSVTSLISLGRQNRVEQQAQSQAQRDHEQQLLDKQLQFQDNKVKEEYAQEEKITKLNIAGKLEVERLQSYGRIDYREDDAMYDRLDKTTQDAVNNTFRQNEIGIKQENTAIKQTEAQARIDNQAKQLQLQIAQLAEKKAKRQSDLTTAIINKN